ncbi:hypothetical protein BC831DRAFT_29510 [Entophlyctis helioformis]|nr:hypothetical protein BC831DRAFT_29510 [Entophlyctis helioformis]
MGKKDGRTINPADALRKQHRQRELKKNREDRKHARLVAVSQRNTAKLAFDYRQLKQQESSGTLDAMGQVRIRQIESKVAEINAARTQLGLAPKTLGVDEGDRPKTAKPEKVFKYYHPTYNPHGKRKPAAGEGSGSGDDDDDDDDDDGDHDGNGLDALEGLASESEASKDEHDDESVQGSDLDGAKQSQDQEQDTEAKIQIQDLSDIPIPTGVAPETDAQVYTTLRISEIVDTKEAALREQRKAQKQRKALIAEAKAARAAQQLKQSQADAQTAQSEAQSQTPAAAAYWQSVWMHQAAATGIAGMQPYPYAGVHHSTAMPHPGGQSMVGMPGMFLNPAQYQYQAAAIGGWGVPGMAQQGRAYQQGGSQGQHQGQHLAQARQSDHARRPPQPRNRRRPPAGSSLSAKPAPLPNKPATPAVISAAPQVRDLRKEQTQFVPAAVRRKAASSTASKPGPNSAATASNDKNPA